MNRWIVQSNWSWINWKQRTDSEWNWFKIEIDWKVSSREDRSNTKLGSMELLSFYIRGCTMMFLLFSLFVCLFVVVVMLVDCLSIDCLSVVVSYFPLGTDKSYFTNLVILCRTVIRLFSSNNGSKPGVNGATSLHTKKPTLIITTCNPTAGC